MVFTYVVPLLTVVYLLLDFIDYLGEVIKMPNQQGCGQQIAGCGCSIVLIGLLLMFGTAFLALLAGGH